MTTLLDGALVWLRRDLRAADNAALYHALKAARRVWCVFVLDRDILDPLPRADRRVEFIIDSLHDLDSQLKQLGERHAVHGCGLIVRHGRPVDEVVGLARQLGVQAVYASHDDDPYALERDARARGALADAGVALHTGKDHVVFERSELLTQGGKPFSVYTPYKNAWLAKLDADDVRAYDVDAHAEHLAPLPPDTHDTHAAHAPRHRVPSLEAIGFEPTNLKALRLPTGSAGAETLLDDFLHRIDAYGTARDFPAVKGPSYLSVHLRHGTVSVRRLAGLAWHRATRRDKAAGKGDGAAVWLSELIWRDFYNQVLHHHPHVVGHAQKPAYDAVRFATGHAADAAFDAWCRGATGYPLVDAAMAQINTTGWMHNRLRMVSAAFLIKDLGVDWRRGEAYFAEHLIDYDLASNNGGWQWSASTGSDAQPYFRIFNPVAQSRKFDPTGAFIRRYLPQLKSLDDAAIHAPWEAKAAVLADAGVALGRDYPAPIVDHAEARARTLERYAVVKSSKAESTDA